MEFRCDKVRVYFIDVYLEIGMPWSVLFLDLDFSFKNPEKDFRKFGFGLPDLWVWAGRAIATWS